MYNQEQAPGNELLAIGQRNFYLCSLECFLKAEEMEPKNWMIAVHKGKVLRKLNHPPEV